MNKVMMFASGKSYHATRWANALADRGVRVKFVTIHRVVRPMREDIDVFELSSVGKVSYALTARRVRTLVKRENPDVVHSHSAGGYALMGALSGGRPWILSVYGRDVYSVPLRSRLHHTVVGGLLQRADQLLSTSHAMAEQVVRLYPSLPRPVVTPFGVDTELFSANRARSRDERPVKIGIVKKLEEKYGVDVLLAAFDLVASRYDGEIELHVVGEGSQRQKLDAIRLKSRVPDRIVFHGAVPNQEVPRFLNDFDIFVVPSREESESFGVAAVEASAAELPVIVSNVGGLPEVVEHEKTGLVVPKEDPEALAVALERLVRRPEDRVRFGTAGRRKVEREYDWSRNVDEMMQIYERVTGTGWGGA